MTQSCPFHCRKVLNSSTVQNYFLNYLGQWEYIFNLVSISYDHYGSLREIQQLLGLNVIKEEDLKRKKEGLPICNEAIPERPP